MTKRCKFEDDRYRCHEPSHRRTGPLAKITGSRPYCVLIDNHPCPEQAADNTPSVEQIEEEVFRLMNDRNDDFDL